MSIFMVVDEEAKDFDREEYLKVLKTMPPKERELLRNGDWPALDPQVDFDNTQSLIDFWTKPQ